MRLGFTGSKLVYQVLVSSLLNSAVSMLYLGAGSGYVPFTEMMHLRLGSEFPHRAVLQHSCVVAREIAAELDHSLLLFLGATTSDS